AEELGDLPLALEQAGALLNETAMPVSTYLELFRNEAGILNEGLPSDYPVPIAAAWSVSESRVSAETPQALELLRRCAFLGPEPIPLELFDDRSHDLSLGLQEVLRDPLVKARAIGALRRYGLARIDNLEHTIQMHRILQRLIRDGIDPEQWDRMRRDVHLLLAAYDRDHPDDPPEWPRYAGLLAHAEPSRAVRSAEPKVRRLVRNLVRYLYRAGDYPGARSYAEATLQYWTADSGDRDPDVLMMKRHLGNVLWALTDYQAAYDLNSRTLALMRSVFGDNDEETLSLTNTHAADLRVRGEFADALRLDEESVRRHRRALGEDHPRTFMAVSNLALDHWISGDYRTALTLLEENYRDRLD
ncbi:MAG: FxSxx-COOH system tetratricopeptide repeat protein, partial [Pseudomonas sp.]